MVLLCVTEPLSPGLRTRTDTLVVAGPACGIPDPRSWGVEAALGSSSEAATGGESSVEVGLSHVQFHTQFHIQSREALLPMSVEVEVAFPSHTVSVQVQFHGSTLSSASDGSFELSED